MSETTRQQPPTSSPCLPTGKAPAPPLPVLERENLLGAFAPMRNACTAAHAGGGGSPAAASPTTIGMNNVIMKSSSEVVTFRDTAPNTGSDGSKKSTAPREPPRSLFLPSSWSLPHLCAADAAAEPTFAYPRSHLRRPTIPRGIPRVSASSYSLQDNKEDKKISKVLDYLYVGNLEDAIDADVLEAHKIRRVLNVSDMNVRGPQILNDQQHFFRIPIPDTNQAKLFPYFDETFEFIESARLAHENVLIHCMAGISRSPTLAIAYLMRSRRMGFDEAFQIVKQKRPIISPNMNFIGQLSEYEEAMRARHILPPLNVRHSYAGESIFTNKDTEISTARNHSLKSNDLTDMDSQTMDESQRHRREHKIHERTSVNKSCSSDFPPSTLSMSATSFSSTETSYSFSMHSTQSSTSLSSVPSSTTSSSTSSSNSLMASLTKIVNENGKRMVDMRSETLRRPTSLFSPSTPSRTFAPFPPQASATNLLNVLPKRGTDEIPSPSTEFSKLDISLMNPCFSLKRDLAANRKTGYARRCSTSTDVSESASSGVFTESSYDDREDDRSSIGVIEDEDATETPTCDANPAPMFVNPMFELTNKNSGISGMIKQPTENVEYGSTEKDINKASTSQQSDTASGSSEESGKCDSLMKDRSHRSILQCVMRKYRHCKDCAEPMQNSNEQRAPGMFYCYCCNPRSGSANRLRSIIGGSRLRSKRLSQLPPLKDDSDEDVGHCTNQTKKPSTSDATNTANLSQQPSDNYDLASDDGFSENWKDTMISDEETLRGEKLLKYINEQIKEEGRTADDASASTSNESLTTDNAENGNEIGETYPSKKKRCVNRINLKREHSNEYNSETNKIHLFEDNSTVSESRSTESSHSSTNTTEIRHIQTRNSHGLYPDLLENKMQSGEEFMDCELSTTAENTSLYPNLLPDLIIQTNVDRSDIMTIYTTESENNSSSSKTTLTLTEAGDTTNVTRTSSMSKQIRKRSTKSVKSADTSAKKPDFEAAIRDPERASVSSASSLEIFVN